jgi:transposase-like protein
LAILGPEIAHRSAGVLDRARDQDRVAAAVARDAALDLSISDERRQTDRRRSGADHPGPERRTPSERRRSLDRRNVAERERRLTPAGRNALNLVATASEHPVALTGEGGLLTALVTEILQRGLEVEIAAHLGHGRWESGARGAENIRNGAYAKRVLTDLGAIKVQMPRDRRGTFEPVIVPKHGRRLLAAAANVAAVYASGMTRGEIRSQLETVTQSRLDRETIDQFTDELEPEIRAWQRRRFDSSYPVLLIDSITLAGRGTRTTRRALDVAVAITAYGDYELLGIWRRPARVQGAARWSPMLDELNYRGITSIEFICCSGGAELAEAAEQVFPLAKVRPGVEALMENSLRTFE